MIVKFSVNIKNFDSGTIYVRVSESTCHTESSNVTVFLMLLGFRHDTSNKWKNPLMLNHVVVLVLFIVEFLAAKMFVSLLKIVCATVAYDGKWIQEINARDFGHSINYEWKKFYRATNNFYDTLSKKWSCSHAQAMIVCLWQFSIVGKTVKSNEPPTFWTSEAICCCCCVLRLPDVQLWIPMNMLSGIHKFMECG